MLARALSGPLEIVMCPIQSKARVFSVEIAVDLGLGSGRAECIQLSDETCPVSSTGLVLGDSMLARPFSFPGRQLLQSCIALQ